MFAARNLAAQGRAEEAERLTRASVELLRTCGDHWMILYGLGMLAGLQESQGDLSAAIAYEELIAACRTAGTTHFESMWLIRLAALRARLGDDVAAERAVRRLHRHQFSNSQYRRPRRSAGAARRLGDLTSCRRWLDEAKADYESVGFPGGSTAGLIGLAWWSLAAGELSSPIEFAEQARYGASEAADPLVGILADTVVAAVALASSDTEANRARFAAALDGGLPRGRSTAFFEATLDDPDVEASGDLSHGLRSG